MAEETRYESGVERTYRTDELEITWEPSLCTHASECWRSLPRVFDPRARPWVTPEGAAADQIAEVVMRCPTGALGVRRTDGGLQELDLLGSAETRVEIVVNGPLEVRGALRFVREDGAVIREATRASLCRCGHSRNKPFCDNSHRRVGWREDS
jgi:uncharacterized Fe-S cluster protein YjdI